MSASAPQSIERVVETLGSLEQPVFYINRPSILMLGVERWMPNFHSIRLHNAWGMHTERAFSPSTTPGANLSHAEAARWLLGNTEVQHYIAKHTPEGFTPQLVIFLHDRETEALAEQLGYRIMAAPVELREQLDSKIFTTELSEACGLRNVPNLITTVTEASELIAQARAAGLGTNLVVQRSHGEGGAGTYFVDGQHEAAEIGEAILGVPIKVMRKVRHRSLAMDAVVVPGGVVLGPLLQEIVGHPEVAVHPGSSSGLEFYAEVLNDEQRAEAQSMVLRYGERLAELGYRGLFGVDLLHDLDTGELYFGESNPRFSGCAMVSNALTAELWGLPLYALHVYAFLSDVAGVDVDEFNRSWQTVGPGHEWANLLIRHIDPEPTLIIEAPRTGRYRVEPDGSLSFIEQQHDWYGLTAPDEVFFLSYRGSGDARIHGDDIGTLFLRGRYQNHEGEFSSAARSLVAGIQSQYRTKPLSFMQRASRGIARRLRRLRG